MKRVSSLLLLSLSLAACGGGGGSTPPTGTPSGGTPQQPQAKVQQIPTQRALAQQSLQTQISAQEAVQFIPGSSSSGLSFRRALFASAERIAAAWRSGTAAAQSIRTASIAYGPCTNSTESATVNVSSTEVQLYQRNFYDTACTQLYQDVFVDALATGTTTVSANGTNTEYARSGAVLSYATLTLQLGGLGTTAPTVSLQLSEAPNQTAPQTESLGLSCGVASTSVDCGLGGFDRVQSLSQDVGVTMNISASESSSGTTTTVPISGSASGYTGALNTLTLSQGTFPSWTIGGGSVVDTVAFNGQFGYTSSGLPVSGTLAMSDSADDATVNVSTVGSPATLNGVIKQTSTGATIATFTVDAYGNGTVAYSNGTTAPISGWNVLG